MTRILTLSHAVLLILFTAFAWTRLNETELAYFTFDSTGVLLLTVLAILSLPTIYHGFIYTTDDSTKRYNIYHAGLMALMTFMAGAYLANTMTVLWIFVEATTLAVAVLIYHDRTEMALEATWKYVFICSTGIALAYLGILFLGFIYGRGDAPNLSFESFSLVIGNASPLYLKISFIFVLVGFSTKMGLFPMHTVTIDAHSVAPPPVSALISTTLMNVGFLAIFRVYKLFASTSVLPFMNHVLILAGLLSLLIAAGYMLKAKHLKRMLAYSSLENMGLVAIAIGAGGAGYYAALLLIILHSLRQIKPLLPDGTALKGAAYIQARRMRQVHETLPGRSHGASDRNDLHPGNPSVRIVHFRADDLQGTGYEQPVVRTYRLGHIALFRDICHEHKDHAYHILKSEE
ncbi:MAG: hypothetical protein MZV63_09210 [Marinilabiliales bacterium]|nr:hypothetical protein [Marinilabiliales bacterium]